MSVLAQSPSPEEFLSGKLTAVDVVGIERELRALWQSVQTSGQGYQGNLVARACVLNLILHSADSDAEVKASELLSDITVQHPCRALLAIHRQSSTTGLDAWVSARCHMAEPSGARQICCEQITVRWEGAGVHELPSVVLPLLVPDLPVFLWWRTPGLNREEMSPFLSSVDRLILDSSHSSFAAEYFGQVVDLIQSLDGKVVVSGVNWRRTLAWRKLLCSAFEGCGTTCNLDDLKSIESLELEYEESGDQKSSSNGPFQSLILTSWLAGRLNWQPAAASTTSNNGQEVLFVCDKRPIKVEWRGVERSQVPVGTPLSLKITLSGARRIAVLLDIREGLPVLVLRFQTGAGKSQETVGALVDLSEEKLIGQELEMLDRDLVFEETMRMASKIAQLL